LRRELSAARTHLVLEQHQLRQRAAKRFADADRLFFTEQSLQQASDPRTAGYKASRFPADEPVLDLCCGIGGDLSALGQRGPVLGIDRDPLLILLAKLNLEITGVRSFQVAIADADELVPAAWTLVHIDPDRRAKRMRSVHLDWHEPNRKTIARWLESSRGTALKLAPATPTDDPLLTDAECEWIGSRSECQQLVTWYGKLADHPGCRVATLLGESSQFRFVAERKVATEPAARVLKYIAEPVPSMLAADLAGAWAAQHAYETLTAGGGYLTGDQLVDSPWITSYEVLEVLPLREKNITRWLRQRRTGEVVVKQRGLKLDTASWQIRLSQPEGERVTMICLKRGPSAQAIMARRCAP
jgi:hypothetical protein